jgi:hypothetical protein
VQNAGGNTRHRLAGGDIGNDNGPGADDCVISDCNAWENAGAHSHKCADANAGAAGQQRSGTDMSRGADPAFVVHDGGCVDDRRITDLGFNAHDRTGGNDGIVPNRCGEGDGGGGVDGGDELEAGFQGERRIGVPDAVVADGDDGGRGTMLPGDLREAVGLAEDGQAGDGPAGEGGVGIDETDGLIDRLGAKDIEHDLAVPASADDEYPHVSLRFWSSCVRLRAIPRGTASAHALQMLSDVRQQGHYTGTIHHLPTKVVRAEWLRSAAGGGQFYMH